MPLGSLPPNRTAERSSTFTLQITTGQVRLEVHATRGTQRRRRAHVRGHRVEPEPLVRPQAPAPAAIASALLLLAVILTRHTLGVLAAVFVAAFKPPGQLTRANVIRNPGAPRTPPAPRLGVVVQAGGVPVTLADAWGWMPSVRIRPTEARGA